MKRYFCDVAKVDRGRRRFAVPVDTTIYYPASSFALVRSAPHTLSLLVGGTHPLRMTAKTSTALHTPFFIHMHLSTSSMTIAVQCFLTRAVARIKSCVSKVLLLSLENSVSLAMCMLDST